MKVSIIIRTKNEERWITDCLKGVFSQRFKDFEVILVDNDSTDATIAKAKEFPVQKIISCDEYLPGKALNMGIEAAESEYIVCLSGHCIPANRNWLENLVKGIEDPQVAGIYGRQEPLSFTPDSDKRDLMIIFGPERRVQKTDSFFHNANSIIKKELWHRYPFDDKITNIEDRVWAQTVQRDGYVIVYEPEASVYHYHGIHQNGNSARCRNVVRIMENLNNQRYETHQVSKIRDLNIVAFIPIKGEIKRFGGDPLFLYTLENALKSQHIKTTVVTTDNPEIVDLSLARGADLAFLRDESLSQEYVGLEKVYRDALERMEREGSYPDIVVLLEITYPFREENLIDSMIATFTLKGLDTIFPARMENNSIWLDEKDGLKRIDEGFIPRKYKVPVYLSYKGLCCVTRPSFIRSERIIGDNVGVFKIDNPYSCLEIRNEKGFHPPQMLVSAAGHLSGLSIESEPAGNVLTTSP